MWVAVVLCVLPTRESTWAEALKELKIGLGCLEQWQTVYIGTSPADSCLFLCDLLSSPYIAELSGCPGAVVGNPVLPVSG